MVVRSDGTIVVLDPSRGFHLFRPNGDFLETIRPTEPAYANRVVLSGDELVLAGGLLAARLHGTEGQPILRQDLASGSPPEVLLDVPVPHMEMSRTSAGQYTFRRPPLLSPAIRIAPGDADEIAVVYGTAWSIDVVEATGALAERRAHQSQVSGFGGASGFRVTPGAGGAGNLLIADSVPVIRDVRGDGRGVVFVGRETDPVAQPQQQIDIVTTDGDYIGSLRDHALPEAIGPTDWPHPCK